MTKTIARAFALTLGAAALLCPQTAQAADYCSKDFKVPFSFQVDKTTLPAGEYRVEQSFGSNIVLLVNKDTRRSVQMLGFSQSRQTGKMKLAFEATEEGYALRLKS